MFKKVVSHLPFSPSRTGDLTNLQRRLERQQLFYAVGFFGTLLTAASLSLLLVKPGETNTTTDPHNDIIVGGVPESVHQVDAQSFVIQALNDRSVAAAYEAAHISAEDILGTTLTYIPVTNTELFTMGKLQYGGYLESKLSINGFTFYDRPLSYSTPSATPIKALVGTRNQVDENESSWFAISLMNGSPIYEKSSSLADIHIDQFHKFEPHNNQLIITTNIQNKNDGLILNPELKITVPDGYKYSGHFPTDLFNNTSLDSAHNILTLSPAIAAASTGIGGNTNIAIQIEFSGTDAKEMACSEITLVYVDGVKNSQELCTNNNPVALQSSVLGTNCTANDAGACTQDDSSIIRQSIALNLTQHTDANLIDAHPGDEIRYIMSTTSNAKTDLQDVSPKINVNDILEYADISFIDDNGVLLSDNATIQWPATTMKANEARTTSFVVRVHDHVVQTPVARTNSHSHDLVLNSVYGNKIDVPLHTPLLKFAEKLSAQLPTLHTFETFAVATGFALLSGFMYVRNTLLIKELQIIRRHHN